MCFEFAACFEANGDRDRLCKLMAQADLPFYFQNSVISTYTTYDLGKLINDIN